MGTITYLAPEILAGQPATPASDIYSLGAVTYELLSGQPPYQAPTPAALLEAVRIGDVPDLRGFAPDQMAHAVAGAMARDPVSRPETAGAFAATLMGSATMVMPTHGHGRNSIVPAGSQGVRGAHGGHRKETLADSNGRSLRSASRRPVAAGSAPAGSGGSGGGCDGRRPGRWRGNAGCVHHDRCSGDHDPPPPPTTTTTAPTTTTIPTTTTTVVTAESVAGEIGGLLAVLGPPEFPPRDIRQVEDRIERILDEWEKDDREHLMRELERAFEEVGDLEESPERDELTARLIQLSELMGFRVDQIGQGDGEDDDDG